MKSIAEIKAIRDNMQKEVLLRETGDTSLETKIVVGMGTCGINAGATEIYNTLVEEVYAHEVGGIRVVRNGCLGNCGQEPIVEVHVPGKDKVVHNKVTPDQAKKIVADLIK